MALQHATSGAIVEIEPLGPTIDDVPSTAIVRVVHAFHAITDTSVLVTVVRNGSS